MGFFRKKDTPTLSTDPDVLREQQRLLQLTTLDTWMQGTLKEQRRSRRWRIFFRMLVTMLIAASVVNTIYMFNTATHKSVSSKMHIGIVDVSGAIGAEQQANADSIIKGLRKAIGNDRSTHVVLNINSPGGSPTESQRVYEEIRHLQNTQDKPIVSFIGDLGASGAYYMASASSDIYSAPSSLVGSIGVIASSFGATEAIDKLGIERRVFTAGSNKAMLDPFLELSEEQAGMWQGVLDDTYGQFIDDVKEGRGDRLDLSASDELFSGRVWTGTQALKMGLTDGTMTFDNLLRQLSGHEDDIETSNYTPRPDPLSLLSGGLIKQLSQKFSAHWQGSPLSY